MSDTYMENDPKTLEEARTMLLDSWQDIDKGKQAEKRRDELIVQAFDLGASYMDVMVCTGLSRPTVYRIRRRAEQGIPSGEPGWDFSVPGHSPKTDVSQSVLEDTLQDDFFTLLDDAAEDDDHHRDFSSPDLNDKQKAIRDAVHDLARRAAASKSDIVASTALGITLTRHQERPVPPMDATSDEIRAALKRLHLVDKTHDYLLVNASPLSFACPTGELLPHDISYRPGVRKAEGILLYDDEYKQYLGYFPGDPNRDTQTKLLQCTNGSHYDTTGEGHTDLGRADGGLGTCTVIGETNPR